LLVISRPLRLIAAAAAAAAMSDAPGVQRLPSLLAPKPGGVATRALLPPPSAAAPQTTPSAPSSAPTAVPFGGSLTLLSFERGGELKEHATPHEAVIIALACDAGGFEVTLGGVAHALRAPGDALRLPAGARHAVRATGGPFTMLLAKARAPGEETRAEAAA
jgi:quercetin dioxygenase-like cupin family protein